MTLLPPRVPLDDLARVATHMAKRAGRRIMSIYEGGDGTRVSLKDDGSPLTSADSASNEVLVAGLRDGTPDVPVLSEESAHVARDERLEWQRYWLVDPLDGTKEFVERNGSFTVNVALVERRAGVTRSVLGVVHAPVSDVTYVGGDGIGAWVVRGGIGRPIATSTPTAGHARVVVSRSHGSVATDDFVAGLATLFDSVERISIGSSLKLCMIAEGAAHYYPRVGRTMEWDTAAAQAVLEAAGGAVWRYGTRESLAYGKPDVGNPPFLAVHARAAPLPSAYFDERTRS